MMNQEEQECCICYETIGAQNNCTTPCGHSFCFECMMKSLGRNNTCPCCRAVLQEVEEDSDNDGDYEEESDDEYERDELDKLASPEIIAERMTKLGYTMTDILALYMDRIDRVNRRYTRDFTTKLVKDFDDVVETADEEVENLVAEREEMGSEDTRTRIYKEGTVFDIDPFFNLSVLFQESGITL